MSVILEVLLLEVENLLSTLNGVPIYVKIVAYENILEKVLNGICDLSSELTTEHVQKSWNTSFLSEFCRTYTQWKSKDSVPAFVEQNQNTDTCIRKCSNARIEKCDKCDKTFSRSSAFNIHMKRHENDRMYECAECGLRFNIKKDIIAHVKRRHIPPMFCCILCNKKFSNRSTLKNHVTVVHNKEEKYQCTDCHYFAYSDHTLKQHIKSKHDSEEKKYVCVICNTVVLTRALLKVHLRTHTGEKPYRCDECGASFSCSGHLTNHGNSVHGHRNKNCNICSKQFKTIHALKRHTLIHSRVKPFQCPFCKRYASNTHGNLTKHARTVHQMPDFSYSRYKKSLVEQPEIKDSWIKEGEDFTKQYLKDLSVKSGKQVTVTELKEQYLVSKGKTAEIGFTTQLEAYATSTNVF